MKISDINSMTIDQLNQIKISDLNGCAAKKYLWQFHWDCGRQGDVEGMFVATEEEVKESIGKEAYFGEILGKHSEIYGTIEEGEITKVDVDSDAVEKVAAILGETWSGYNPLNYIRYDCDECGDRYRGDEMHTVTKEEKICDYCHREKTE